MLVGFHGNMKFFVFNFRVSNFHFNKYRFTHLYYIYIYTDAQQDLLNYFEIFAFAQVLTAVQGVQVLFPFSIFRLSFLRNLVFEFSDLQNLFVCYELVVRPENGISVVRSPDFWLFENFHFSY